MYIRRLCHGKNAYKNGDNLFIDIGISYKDLDDDYGVKIFYTQTEGMIIETPTCIETCYWYYTESYYVNQDSNICSEARTIAYNSCSEACNAGGGTNCSESCSKNADDRYYECYYATAQRTIYYADESSNKIPYSCNTPPDITYTNYEIANTCE